MIWSEYIDAFYSRTRAARLAAAATFGLGLGGCASLADVNVFSLDQDRAMGSESYEQLLSQEEVVSSGPQAEQVQRVAERLVEAARQFDPEVVDAFEWEVRLLQGDETVNAFALPGGKMAVYTGILPVTQGDAGLAVVMGHEIAHAVERHGTQQVTRVLGADALLAFYSAYRGEDMTQLEALGAPIASTLFTLQYGRSAELDADHKGLLYMARAGYDPREAVAFWERMAGAGGGAGVPEFLSTHPSHGKRIDRLQEMMPEALEIYQQAGGAGTP